MNDYVGYDLGLAYCVMASFHHVLRSQICLEKNAPQLYNFATAAVLKSNNQSVIEVKTFSRKSKALATVLH